MSKLGSERKTKCTLCGEPTAAPVWAGDFENPHPVCRNCIPVTKWDIYIDIGIGIGIVLFILVCLRDLLQYVE